MAATLVAPLTMQLPDAPGVQSGNRPRRGPRGRRTETGLAEAALLDLGGDVRDEPLNWICLDILRSDPAARRSARRFAAP